MANPKRESAQAMFESKSDLLRRIVEFRGRGWSREHAADVLQECLCLLWVRCEWAARAGLDGSAVSCEVAFLQGRARVGRQRRRDLQRLGGRTVGSIEAARESQDGKGRRQTDEPAARAVAFVLVDGVRITLADLAIDYPALVEGLADGGVDLDTVAARFGVHRQTVRQYAHELGGVRVDGEWRFPASTGLGVEGAADANAARG